MRPNLYSLIPALEGEELVYIQNLTAGLTDERLHNFIAVYNGNRRKSDQVLIGCILGFVLIAGVQRFMVRQNGMGLLYLFTGGLCLIGTIVDTINHKQLTFEYNSQVARESLAMVHAMG